MSAAPAPRRFPFPPFPSGWFQVAYGDELAPGAVVPLTGFGRELVLFRDEAGAARLFDAHCPHLGAHLGHGGRVEGDGLVCPFHAWRFDGDGRCVAIPYARKIPPAARLSAWTVLERCGLIMAWHDPGGRPPWFELPELPEYGSDQWTPYERRTWTVRTRNQEMAENAVDSAHFRFLHGTPNQSTTTAEADGAVLRVRSDTGMATPRGGVAATIESTSWGFGFSTVRFHGIVETLLVGCTVPIDEERVQVRFSFSVRRSPDTDITRGVGRAFVREVSRQLEQDIPIWENKVYRDPPLLCDGDGPIGLFRRWALQFYPPAAVAG
jgi:phenylpropionate dioxygenase-like ring-hydroxylating dioxygenase large terminal subunit